jgi:hypothetical protein
MKIIGNGLQKPNPREKSILLVGKYFTMQESGQLKKILSKTRRWFSGGIRIKFGIFFADGHTEQMIPHIQYKTEQLFFFS